MGIQGFDGIYPAIVSPRDSSGAFSTVAFEKLIDRLYGARVQGLYVCGNTGEGYLMSVAERKLAAEVAVKASAGRGKVVVHVGAPAERDAVELASHATKVGADGIASLPPYVQGYRFGDILGYYSAIAKAGGGIPAWVYYIPAVTHREFSLAEVEQLLEIDEVVGLKFTNHNLYLMEGILNGPHKPHVFNGHDEVMLAGLVMGAQAGIGSFYNLMPEHFVKIYEAVKARDLETGRKLQEEVNRLVRITVVFGLMASIREVLRWQGIDCGDPIRPTRPLDEAQRGSLRKELKAANIGVLEG
ncbi:MAG: dihydrodipicolinate synthase family protein [bacterium]|nr:dihydrodipicolinate synthase family protein [bacterium]